MKSYKTFLLLVNYYNRLIMNLMRIPLDHSAAEGSSSGKSQLLEGQHEKQTVVINDDVPLSLSICVYVLL